MNPSNLKQVQQLLNDALDKAAEEGDLEKVKNLVEVQKADVCSSLSYSLVISSKKGHKEVVKFLVEKGADVHTLSDLPLIYACQEGHLDVVKILVEKGADVSARDNMPILYAAINRHTEIAAHLLSKGVNAKTLSPFLLQKAGLVQK